MGTYAFHRFIKWANNQKSLEVTELGQGLQRDVGEHPTEGQEPQYLTLSQRPKLLRHQRSSGPGSTPGMRWPVPQIRERTQHPWQRDQH